MAAYEFDWDAVKAAGNLRKHGVSFDAAMAIFNDPLLLTIADPDREPEEERWISIGEATAGQLLLAVHTFTETDDANAKIRIISARRPTKREARQYREGL
jgi:hypothetical protein